MTTVSNKSSELNQSFLLGNYRQAIEVGSPALEASEEVVISAAAKGTTAALPSNLLYAEAEVGHFTQAFSDGQVMMRRADAAGHPFVIAVVCACLGYAHLRSGAEAQAVPLLERGVKLCQTYAIDVQFPQTASSLGLAYAFAGRHQEGIEDATQAGKSEEGVRLTRYQPMCMSLLANPDPL